MLPIQRFFYLRKRPLTREKGFILSLSIIEDNDVGNGKIKQYLTDIG